MPKTNKVSVVFTDVQKEIALEKIAEAKAAMPFLISLTTEERKRSQIMGPKSLDYVRQCLEGAKAFPDELKKSFDTAEMEKDYEILSHLLGVQIACQEVMELINDTLTASGIEALEAANEVYASLKLSAKGNASVKGMVDKISERFKGQGKSKKPKTT
jgi:hypothetical protein